MRLPFGRGCRQTAVQEAKASSQMATQLLVSCCLPAPAPAAAAGAKPAASSSSAPPDTKSKSKSSRAHARVGRRDFVLRSSELATLAAIFHFSGTKPSYLGVQKSPPSLALCPATNNCVSTSEEISDSNHYAPPWNYNPKDGRRGKPITKEEAMKELIAVVRKYIHDGSHKSIVPVPPWNYMFLQHYLIFGWNQVTKTKPDNFTPRIVDKTDDYIRVEYESPIFGFVDDVEFWFPPGSKPIVQYRSASRSGFIDFNANKKRVKELRLALEKKGWASESNF